MWLLKLEWVIVFNFGMIGKLGIFLLNFFTLFSLHAQLIRKLLSLMVWVPEWCGDCTLQEAFPELHSFRHDKESSSCIFLTNASLGQQFPRAIQDWELQPLTAFINLIYSMPLKGEGHHMTNFVGNQHKVRVLRCVSTISPFPQLLAFFFCGSLHGAQRSLLG